MMGKISWDQKENDHGPLVYIMMLLCTVLLKNLFLLACSGPDEAEGVGHGAGQPQAGSQD
jgi:hypothetical protein